MQKSRVLFWGFALSLFFISNFLQAEHRDRIRSPKAQCGYYLTSVKNTSIGIHVADFSEESFEAFLEENPNLEEQMVYIVGTELWGSEKRAKLSHAREALEQRGYANQVKSIDRPKGIFQHIRAFFPMKQHWQRITRGEVEKGLWKLSLSGTAPIVVLLSTQPPEIAWPVGLVNLIQSAMMTFPRQFWGNWQTANDHWWSRWPKQFLISAAFTAGLYWAAQYGQGLMNDPEHTGDISQILSASAWWVFLKTKLSSMVFQTLWRTPVHNGVYEWVNVTTHEAGKRSREEGVVINERARDSAARIETVASLITTQFFIFSSIAGDNATLFHFIFDWNAGHLGMAAMGLVGAAGWKFPHMWDPGARAVDYVWAKAASVLKFLSSPAVGAGKVTFKGVKRVVGRQKTVEEEM